MNALRCALPFFLATLTACGSKDDSSAAATQADAAAAPAPYTIGASFPELQLEGYLDRNGNRAFEADEFGAFRISDVVAKSPEYLLVHVAFGWCEWCWREAKEQIKWVEGYGGRLAALQVYVDDLRGTRADRGDLEFWIENNKSYLPAGLEKDETLFAKFGKNATYLLIDVKSSMRIIDVGAGPPAFERIRAHLVEKLPPLPN